MQPLVVFDSVSKEFQQKAGLFGGQRSFFAVRNVSLEILPGKTLGVVGESGSGKSTLARIALGLLQPTSGGIVFDGRRIISAEAPMSKEMRRELAGKIQMVFQDPYSSLNPRMRIGKAIEEPLLWAGETSSKGERELLVDEMLERVGLGHEHAKRYPHEFSGGQRQRVAIARALITRPLFVVCDEPTSALDASIQAQVLNLLKDMQDSFGLTYLFISHDLAVVRHMADRVAVMREGEIVETAETEELFANPAHPYTRLLLDSIMS